MNRNYFIYILRDMNTNKVRYVGQTSVGKKRFKSHINKSNRKQPISCYIKKVINSNNYPKFEIIEYCQLKQLDEREIFYIAYYKNKKCNLLNLTDGGSSFRGYKMTKDDKLKISKALKGKPSKKKGTKMLESSKVKMSISAKKRIAKYNPMKGKNHSEYSKIRMSETKKERFKTGEITPSNLRYIKCLNNEKVYKSSQEAANDLKLPASSIRSVLQGKSKALYGKYKFEYKD